MPEYDEILLHTREEWRDWLAENHQSRPGIWLIYHKKHTGIERVAYDAAVEEALCFGWIDSTAKRLDDARYMQTFTPRKDRSNWSALNRRRAEKLLASGMMCPAGQRCIDVAKENGAWERALEDRDDRPEPVELTRALEVDAEARKNWARWTPTQRKYMINHVAEAKKAETRERRAAKVAAMARANRKPGM